MFLVFERESGFIQILYKDHNAKAITKATKRIIIMKMES